jgi:hypothetical protein
MSRKSQFKIGMKACMKMVKRHASGPDEAFNMLLACAGAIAESYELPEAEVKETTALMLSALQDKLTRCNQLYH